MAEAHSRLREILARGLISLRKGNSSELGPDLPNTFRHRFGALVRQRREANGLTQMDAARVVFADETKSSRISDIERGRNEPNADTINAVCAGLKIDLAEVERLRESATNNWPEILDPSIRLERQVRGREGDVAALHTNLTNNNAVAIVPGTVVKGAGGMGKSTLARYYAEQYAHAYRGVWWLGAQTTDTLVKDLGKLAGHLGIKAADHATAEALASAVVMALNADSDPWLLIFDNAETLKGISAWLPKGKTVLVTSREGVWKNFAVQQADRLIPSDGAELLMQEAERTDDREGAGSLSKALDGLPLALVLAGGWLHDTSESFADYEARIDALIDLKPEDVEVEDYPDSVFGAVNLSLEKLPKDAALLMRVFAYLSPDDLWPGLVTALADKDATHERYEPVPDELWTLAQDRAAVERAFADLTRRSLLEKVEDEDKDSPPRKSEAKAGASSTQAKKTPDNAAGVSGEGKEIDPLDQSYRMHRLTSTVQRTIIEKEESPPRKSEAKAGVSLTQATETPDNADGGSGAVNDARPIAAALLAASYPGGASNPQHRENWPACVRRQPHVAQLAETPPEIAAMDYLLNQASSWLDSQRRDELALKYAETSLRLKEARLGPDHSEVGTACNNLAVFYWRAGHMEDAEEKAARAVAISDAGAGSQADRAVWLSVHGIMAAMVGRGLAGKTRDAKLALASDRYRQALSLKRKNNFEVRLYTPWISNLADLRAYQGRWGAALPLLGRAFYAGDFPHGRRFNQHSHEATY